jgi:hypothetical protein
LADRDQEIALHEESLRIRRELGDKRGIAMSLFNLGEGLLDDDFERAEVMIEEGLRLWQELGDKTFVSTRSWISLFRGAYAGSRTGRPARLAKELRRRGERPHYRAARRGRLRPSRSLRQGPPLHAGAGVILAVLGLEEVVGEMSLADSPGRSASVTTLEEGVFL